MAHTWTVWQVSVKFDEKDDHYTAVLQTLHYEVAAEKAGVFITRVPSVKVDQLQFTGSLHKAEFDMADLFVTKA